MTPRDRLTSIQWITNHEKFNEHQLIQLGDAISTLSDSLDELDRLKSMVSYLKENDPDAYDWLVEHYQ